MNNSDKEKQYRSTKNKALVVVIISWLVFIYGVFGDHQLGDSIGVIGFIIFAISAITFNLSNSQYQKLHVGSMGEKVTQAFLVELPEEYQRLSNVEVEFEGQKCEIDNLIISPKGICIIETKNLTGRITGGENDSEWRRRKTSRNGNWYFSKIRNPIKQTKRQVYILSHYLESKGLRTWIDFYVFLNEAKCLVDSDKIILNKTDLLEKIKQSGRDNNLSSKKIENIVNLFKDEENEEVN